ncbi:MAG: LuxR family transcriptional regulator [Bacteroidetes bacterium]|nr:LuxR family transcriptional regulator [Bacteroidota bacterium]
MKYNGFDLGNCETFVKDAKLIHIYEGKVYYGMDIPNKLLEKYRSLFYSDIKAMECIIKMGFKDKADGLAQFIKCRFGGADLLQADVDGKKFNPDWFNCGKHGSCPYEFTICKPVITTLGEKLSRCEVAVMKLIAEDMTDKQIGDKLFVSENTVHSHRVSLTQKIGCHSKSGIVRFAIEKGITL